jgi:hypothetical protein
MLACTEEGEEGLRRRRRSPREKGEEEPVEEKPVEEEP